MGAALEVQNVSKFYGDFKAVNDVSFSLESGRIYGFLGRNGAGKTTFIGKLATRLRAQRVRN